jgi:hypothetical protein
MSQSEQTVLRRIRCSSECGSELHSESREKRKEFERNLRWCLKLESVWKTRTMGRKQTKKKEKKSSPFASVSGLASDPGGSFLVDIFEFLVKLVNVVLSFC